jgi:hypothetical protein
MSEQSGDGWEGYIGGNCPVQGWGRVDGHPWYFRARGAAWSMEIAESKSIDPEWLPVEGEASCWLIEEDWGVWPQAGYMADAIAWQLIRNVIDKFRVGQLPYLPITPDS